MKIYNYHPEFKYFLYSEEAKQSPLDPPGTWLFPANSTTIKPPSCDDEHYQYWNGKEWEIRNIEMHKIDDIKFCPLIQQECIKNKCEWYINDKCSITLLPQILSHLIK